MDTLDELVRSIDSTEYSCYKVHWNRYTIAGLPMTSMAIVYQFQCIPSCRHMSLPVMTAVVKIMNRWPFFCPRSRSALISARVMPPRKSKAHGLTLSRLGSSGLQSGSGRG